MNDTREPGERSQEDLSYSPRDDLLRLVPRWYWLLAFGLCGALIGGLAAGLMPSHVRAFSSVMVDHNLEIALAERGLEDVHRYLNQETLKLEQLAYSETVWDQVERELRQHGWEGPIPSRDELQERVLLPHPEDGEWSFAADGADRNAAAALSKSWAASFVTVVSTARDHAAAGLAERRMVDQLAEELAKREAECAGADAQADCPAVLEHLAAQRESAHNRAREAESASLGVSPFVAVFPLSDSAQVIEVGADQGPWILAISALGLLLGAAAALVAPPINRGNRRLGRCDRR